MAKNSRLKLKLWEQGITQQTLSSKTGIPRTYISLGINGRYVFDEGQKQKIAEVLELKAKQLFE